MKFGFIYAILQVEGTFAQKITGKKIRKQKGQKVMYLSCIKDIMHLITKELLRSFKLAVLWRIKFYPFWEQEVLVFRCSGKIGLGKKYQQQLTYDGGHILNAKKSFKLHFGRKKFLENEKMLPDYWHLAKLIEWTEMSRLHKDWYQIPTVTSQWKYPRLFYLFRQTSESECSGIRNRNIRDDKRKF